MSESELEVRPTSLIKGFGEVNINDIDFLGCFFYQVKGFLSCPNSFADLALTEESKLFHGNHPRKNRFNMKRNSFRYDFLNSVADRDGSVIIKDEGFSVLGMRAKKVTLKPSYILPVLLHSSMAYNRSSPISSKKEP